MWRLINELYEWKKGCVYRITLICYAGNEQYKFFLNWNGCISLRDKLEIFPNQPEERGGTLREVEKLYCIVIWLSFLI